MTETDNQLELIERTTNQCGKLLDYLKSKDAARYTALITRLGLRR